MDNSKSKKSFYILSLNGGGSRAILSIQWLQRLEEEIQKIKPEFRIADYFDMFGGASSGAILAMGFGILNYSAKKLNDLLSRKNLKKMMNKSLIDKVFDIYQTKPKYTNNGKKEVLSKYFGNKKFIDSNNKLLVIPTYSVEDDEAVIFRTSKANPYVTACDIATATSSAPAYFPTHYIEHCEENGEETKSKWLIDGGVCCNDTSVSCIGEARRHLILNGQPNREIRVLSIGTGIHKNRINGKNSQGFGGISWLTHGILDITMNETIVDKQAKWLLHKDCYIRVNGNLCDYGIASELDNTSNNNIKKLRMMGDDLWTKFGKQTIKLLQLE